MYLIDGHNLIGSGAVAGIDLSQADDEQRLEAYLRARKPARRHTMTVVFDGGIGGGASMALSGGGVSVVFSPQGRGDADSVILSRVKRGKKGVTVIVVSNDAALLQKAKELGANVQRVTEFLQVLDKPRRHPHRRSVPVTTDADKPLPTKAANDDLLKQFEDAARQNPSRRRR